MEIVQDNYGDKIKIYRAPKAKNAMVRFENGNVDDEPESQMVLDAHGLRELAKVLNDMADEIEGERL